MKNKAVLLDLHKVRVRVVGVNPNPNPTPTLTLALTPHPNPEPYPAQGVGQAPQGLCAQGAATRHLPAGGPLPNPQP